MDSSSAYRGFQTWRKFSEQYTSRISLKMFRVFFFIAWNAFVTIKVNYWLYVTTKAYSLLLSWLLNSIIFTDPLEITLTTIPSFLRFEPSLIFPRALLFDCPFQPSRSWLIRRSAISNCLKTVIFLVCSDFLSNILFLFYKWQSLNSN